MSKGDATEFLETNELIHIFKSYFKNSFCFNKTDDTFNKI